MGTSDQNEDRDRFDNVELSIFPRRGLLDFKRPYDVRSSIVRGGAADPKRLKSPAGAIQRLAEFAALADQLMRSALKKAIESEEPEDWDAMAVP